MNWITKVLGVNWKSNLIAIVAFVGTVPSIVTAISQFINHQPIDWHVTAGGLLLALLAYVVKDASTHSTVNQVEASQAKVEGLPQAVALIKAADKQAEGK